MNTAVLLIIFNRPDTTAKVMDRLRQVRPSRLYVAADGPRDGNLRDAERCEITRKIASAVDWPCDLRTRFSDQNQGCRRGVSGAIDWLFENEPEGIILEDDCLPSVEFFEFCSILLERYRVDDRVAQISGSNFVGAQSSSNGSYYFSGYPDIWGWATWRRSWSHYDLELSSWPTVGRKLNIGSLVGGGALASRYWRHNIEKTWRGQIDTWDYQWLYSIWMRGALNIIPQANLIENIGYGEGATHTTHQAPAFLRAVEPLELPLRHPDLEEASRLIDRSISRVRYNITVGGQLTGQLRDWSNELPALRWARKLLVR